MWRTPDEMRAGLTSGTMQAVVVMPISTAVNLNTRGLGVRLANVMTNGLLYVISTDERIRSVADLKGHRITVPFPNDTPELVFDAVLAHHGLASEVAVDRAGTPFETIQMLLAGRIETAMVSDADGRGCQSARNIDPLSASNIGSDSYVERPGWQGVGGMNLRRTVQSYVRPVVAVIDRWPR